MNEASNHVVWFFSKQSDFVIKWLQNFILLAKLSLFWGNLVGSHHYYINKLEKFEQIWINL